MSSSHHETQLKGNGGDSLGPGQPAAPGRPDPRGPIGLRPDPLPFAQRLQRQAQEAIARVAGRITPGAPMPVRRAELRVRLVTSQGADVAEHVLPPRVLSSIGLPPLVIVWGSRVFVHRSDIGLVYEESSAFFIP